MSSPFILDAVRTPIGRYGGAYSSVRPDDLAAAVVRALAERTSVLDPGEIDDVVLGNANGAGEENRNVARMAVLLAGLPPSVPATTANRLCGSGLEAVAQASRTIAVGDAGLCIAGGVESMTRAPWVLPKSEAAFPHADQTLHSTTLGWRLVNPRMPAEWTVGLGEATEILADRYNIDREAQDAFALASHRKAQAAWGGGRFDAETVTVTGGDPGASAAGANTSGAVPERSLLPLLSRDEGIRPDSSLEALARLRPAFRPEGTVTAGNSSPLSDGAAALLLGDEAAASRLGVKPLARIAGRGVSAVEPPLFGIGPVAAAETALKRAGVGWGDLVAVELNEAFAAQALACLGCWPDLDPSLVNPNGGAVAMGHPIGASGARILATLAWELHRRGGGYGLAAICIGVGQGLAVVLEA
jgi:acetyl-CoA acetyltransferase family protein